MWIIEPYYANSSLDQSVHIAYHPENYMDQFKGSCGGAVGQNLSKIHGAHFLNLTNLAQGIFWIFLKQVFVFIIPDLYNIINSGFNEAVPLF